MDSKIISKKNSKIGSKMNVEAEKLNLEEEEFEAINQDPTFHRGTNAVFNFKNGDVYEGEYIAHISGVIWREGKGTYTTQDGQVYSGIWYNDELKENTVAEIKYLNGAVYSGKVVKSQYSGPGMYTVHDGLHILCNFADNKPVGEICLLDVKGREWREEAGERDALLLPEHIFFNDIPPRLGKGTLRIQRAHESIDQGSVKSIRKTTILDRETLNKLEMKIFAKTKKTISNLKFENSNWYNRWIRFRQTYDKINYTIKTLGDDGLCQDERDWINKYNEFKERYTYIMERRLQPKYKRLSEYKLFQLFNSGDYMPPISVFTSQYGKESEEKIVCEEEEETFSQSFAWQM